MLGVSIENNFSIAQHVQRLVTASAQTVYALHVLRTRGLDDDALQHIYRATVVARLTYAASAWCAMCMVLPKRQTAIASTLCWIVRGATGTARYLPTFDELCNIADDELFGRAMRLPNHVLHALIPL